MVFRLERIPDPAVRARIDFAIDTAEAVFTVAKTTPPQSSARAIDQISAHITVVVVVANARPVLSACAVPIARNIRILQESRATRYPTV